MHGAPTLVSSSASSAAAARAVGSGVVALGLSMQHVEAERIMVDEATKAADEAAKAARSRPLLTLLPV